MKKHQDVVGVYATLIFSNGEQGVVKCTISDQLITSFSNDTYTGRKSIYFNILKEDLINQNLPIKNFKSVIYNRVTYDVNGYNETSSFDNVISIEGIVLGGEK